jgi:dihydrofolate reductase
LATPWRARQGTGDDWRLRRGYRGRAMIGRYRIEGYAIVSANGMIADRNGIIPNALRNDADQQFLQDELDRAALILHGRHSHEGSPRAAHRKRLVLTRRILSFAPDPSYPHSLLWNPAGATLQTLAAMLDIAEGTVAVIGGTEPFGLFLPYYDAFHLTRAARAEIPGGRPLFPQVGPDSAAEDVLARHGLKPGTPHEIDPTASVALTTWSGGLAARSGSRGLPGDRA